MENRQPEVNRAEDTEIEIDLAELFMQLIRHWIQIAAAIVLLAAVFFAGTKLLITPQYSSTSVMYVVGAGTSISLSDLQIGANLTNDYIQVITGRPVLDQVSENLGLDMEYKDFYGRVSVNNPSDSRLLEITVKDPDPRLAKTMADEVAEVASAYIEEKMGQDAPKIIQYGHVNSSPASPSVKKNTAMGGLIGLVLALVIIVVSYLVNDTIMSSEDMEKKIGLQVLGSLPLEESEYNGGRRKGRNKRRKSTSKKPGITSNSNRKGKAKNGRL